MSLTVYFNGQYWCGLIEYYDEKNCLIVKQHIFGTEPSNNEVLEFVTNELPRILSMKWLVSVTEINTEDKPRKINPKRMQRMINQQKKKPVISTKSQDAIKLQQEEHKQQMKANKKLRKHQYQREQYEKKQAKKREKHNGH